MARHYIGFTQRGATAFKNVRKDITGEPLLYVDESEVKTLVMDFAAYLDSGETISSATSTTKNVTASIANTTSTVTLTLSGAQYDTDARVTVVVTFSTGDKWRGNIKVRRMNRFKDEHYPLDYFNDR